MWWGARRGARRVIRRADGEGLLPPLPCSNEWVSLSLSTPSLPGSLCRGQEVPWFGPGSLPLQVMTWGGQGWWPCLIWEVVRSQAASLRSVHLPGPAARSHPRAACPAHRTEAGGPLAACPPAGDPTPGWAMAAPGRLGGGARWPAPAVSSQQSRQCWADGEACDACDATLETSRSLEDRSSPG